MARPLRIEFPGAVYHVTSRGDRREPIFLGDVDRENLLSVLGQALHRFDACAVAWCFMDNHYHFVLHTRQPNLSLLMRHINGVYTQRFNRRHGKVGHLFQGRFKAILVDRDAYLLEVCRYVELNRVRAHLVEHPAQWPWCSYHALAGLSPAPDWLDAQAVWGYLLGRDAQDAQARAQAAQAYVALVQAGQGVQLWAQGLRQQMYLGNEDFVLRMQALTSDRAVSAKEIPKQQRASPKSLQDWLAECPTRDQALVQAHYASQISLSEIARQLGLSVSRVSRIVSAHRAAILAGSE
ncbi:transposase [Acidovorax sp. Root267]|uniref:transposase n=1 Tax=Acidovorax sp. Root267 TaxID=1736505 RepID=UPI00070E9662|nr:transposase [Acidovorax sp. Root267]KRD13494.1 transposase [Acidovorax sp. Root267]